jgi:nucleotide-binding universal stress UspA family protein
MDGSESSKCALNEAIRVAAFTTAKLRVVFVLDASEMYAYPVGFRDVLREDGRRVLEDAQRNLEEGGIVGEVEIVETANVPEDVASCLQRLVLRDRTDLVVMGTHGRRGWRRMLLGSVAERFLRFSTCPVLLVRGRDSTE